MHGIPRCVLYNCFPQCNRRSSPVLYWSQLLNIIMLLIIRWECCCSVSHGGTQRWRSLLHLGQVKQNEFILTVMKQTAEVQRRQICKHWLWESQRMAAWHVEREPSGLKLVGSRLIKCLTCLEFQLSWVWQWCGPVISVWVLGCLW